MSLDCNPAALQVEYRAKGSTMNPAMLLLLASQLPGSADFSPKAFAKDVGAARLSPILRAEFCQHNLGTCSNCGTVVQGGGDRCPACGAEWTYIKRDGKTYITDAGRRRNSPQEWYASIFLGSICLVGLASICGLIWLVQFLIEQHKAQLKRARQLQQEPRWQPSPYDHSPPRDPRCGY